MWLFGSDSWHLDAGSGAVRPIGPKCPPETAHRQLKYLNNIVEADHANSNS
jgi:hypothetical protein